MAWTYNEPTIWLEHTIDSAINCKKEGLYTVYVTNGYITEQALDEIAPHLDVYRVDIKAFNKKSYRELARIPSPGPIFEAAVRAKRHWGLHVEVVTNVIPTINDDDESLQGIATWVCKELGEATPWHVTRFYPYLGLSGLEPTPLQTLEKARDIGLASGLNFVYIGNVPGHEGENTYCPNCKSLVVERTGYEVSFVGYKSGNCGKCGTSLGIVS